MGNGMPRQMGGIIGGDSAVAAEVEPYHMPADPSLDVLLMSGYVDDDGLSARISSSGIPLIEKPYRAAALGQQVTKVFEARRAGPTRIRTLSRES